MNPKFADLHLHTNFSDGTYSPQELLEETQKAGLSAIAVVDHDTVEGLQPTIEIAKTKNIEVIPGIELSSEYENLEIHILGYFIDYRNGQFLSKLESLKKNRRERIYKMTEKLKILGLDLNPEAVFTLAGNGTVGRLHVARALVAEGFVKTIFEAFKKYIGDKGPAYVLGFRFSVQEAINLIKDAGGLSVLAHPYILNNDELIPEFVKFGIRGLEIYYPEHSQSMVNFYLAMAKKHNLLVTGGSDCHGNAKTDVRIGSIKIPYELVEELKEAISK